MGVHLSHQNPVFNTSIYPEAELLEDMVDLFKFFEESPYCFS